MLTRQQLLDVCQQVLAPIIEADAGELYVVDVTDDSLTLHLGGMCSGCPGLSATVRSVIEPALRSLPGQVALKVSSGPRLPQGAIRIRPPSQPSSGPQAPAGSQGLIP
jgi:Fe-S cluster biogenesis protein NfuA